MVYQKIAISYWELCVIIIVPIVALMVDQETRCKRLGFFTRIFTSTSHFELGSILAILIAAWEHCPQDAFKTHPKVANSEDSKLYCTWWSAHSFGRHISWIKVQSEHLSSYGVPILSMIATLWLDHEQLLANNLQLNSIVVTIRGTICRRDYILEVQFVRKSNMKLKF